MGGWLKYPRANTCLVKFQATSNFLRDNRNILKNPQTNKHYVVEELWNEINKDGGFLEEWGDAAAQRQQDPDVEGRVGISAAICSDSLLRALSLFLH